MRDRQRADAWEAERLTVRSLSQGEALLLWGMRHWVACLKRGSDPIPALVAGFAPSGLARAVRPLEAILLITLEHATVPRDVRCPRCTTVGDGEIDLLAAVALQQARRSLGCECRLRRWLPAEPAGAAKDFVAELANAMHHQKMTVPVRREYGARCEGGAIPDQRAVQWASRAVH